MTITERDERLVDCLPIIQSVINGLHLPSHVDTGSLHGVGLLGLIGATSTFEAERGEFRNYARLRIRGSVLDELRRIDPCPRRARALFKLLGKTTDELELELHRAPTDEELRARLGLTSRQLANARASCPPNFLSLDKEMNTTPESTGSSLHELVCDEDSELVPDSLERADQAALLTRLITELPPKMQRMLAYIYEEGLKLWQVGEILHLTESRITQLRQEAFAILRRGLLLQCNQ